MSSLVFVPPDPASPDGSTVSAGAWWPAIDCNALRDALRLGEVITHARLLGAIRGALVTVLGELRDWQAAQVEAGFSALAEVDPATAIGGVTLLQECFLRAVRFHAAAELAVLHADITATADGQTRTDARLLTADDYRQLATHAIRDMLGVTRTSVELI